MTKPWKCSQCSTIFVPNNNNFSCPNCLSNSTSPMNGNSDTALLNKQVQKKPKGLVCWNCGKKLSWSKYYDFKEEGKYCYECMKCSECGKEADGKIRHLLENKPYCPDCVTSTIKSMEISGEIGIPCDKCEQIVDPRLIYDFKELGKYCVDCMQCSVCGSKAVLGDTRGIWFDVPYCKDCWDNRQKRTEGFEKRFGKILLHTKVGNYYGGHKAYLSGGFFTKEETGQMWLTEKYLLFSHGALQRKNRFRLTIPLEKVIISDWDILDTPRRQEFRSMGVFFDGFGFTNGVLVESGKKHQIVLPYIDENGIAQAPRFAVYSVFGGAVKKWAKAIYEQIVKLKKEHKPFIETQRMQPKSDDNPLDTLKKRLAAGDITIEEYKRIKSILEG